MSKKKDLSPELLAECHAAHELFLSKKNTLKLSQKKVADELGVSPAAVAHYFSGTNVLNVKFATALARLLDVPVESFSPRLATEIANMVAATEQTNIAPMLQPHRGPKEYPLISWISAGERCESAPCCATPEAAEDWLPSTENAGEYGYWLKVKGKSMTSDSQPSFPEGTPILIRPEGFDILSGKFYIARHTSGETTFKQYIQDAGIGYLVPLNPKYQTVTMDGTWEIIGRAIDAKITGL